MECRPLHWEQGVLATGPPGKYSTHLPSSPFNFEETVPGTCPPYTASYGWAPLTQLSTPAHHPLNWTWNFSVWYADTNSNEFPQQNSYPSLPSPQSLPPVYLLLTIITSPAGLLPRPWPSAQSSGCQDNSQKRNPRLFTHNLPPATEDRNRGPSEGIHCLCPPPPNPTPVPGDWGLRHPRALHSLPWWGQTRCLQHTFQEIRQIQHASQHYFRGEPPPPTLLEIWVSCSQKGSPKCETCISRHRQAVDRQRGGNAA